ncbi:MAG: Druantia anti-phage system protein DruA [Terriglobia bacterium]
MYGPVLEALVKRSLRQQGFVIQNGRLIPEAITDKDRLREIHATAVQHKRDEAKKRLARFEPHLLSRYAAGTEVRPALVTPKLVQVRRGSEDEALFRYATLHWSIPVSSGYGRRIRFLVIDEQNNKLMGLIGLGDPVFSLRPRDEFIGWTRDVRQTKLKHVMDAFVLGAVPPYSHLIGGKLVAMLAASTEVRNAFRRKYKDTSTLIRGRHFDGRLALVTTTSAFGRSSQYNRTKFDGRLLFQSVGYTQGSGEFHFANGLYSAMQDYTREHFEPTAKQDLWGTGFRNRREIIKKCLGGLGLSTEWIYHGVKREIFVAPLARNSREFLSGEAPRLQWFNQTAADLSEYCRARWMIPRAARDTTYLTFRPESYRLWPDD